MSIERFRVRIEDTLTMSSNGDSFCSKKFRQLWRWKLELSRLRRLQKPTYRNANPKPGGNAWSLLGELQETKKAIGTDGLSHDTQPFITEGEGKVLYKRIIDTKPRLALETGFLHGYSTLHILQGLADVGSGRLLSIDPFQFGSYAHGVGLMNVRRAGLDRHHLFWPEESQFVLPYLCQRGVRVDFAFIDGCHLLDFAMLDFFFIDKMIGPGAQVVFHDYVNPSVFMVVQFVEANLPYIALPCSEKNLRILCKKENDARPWYYFVPFRIPDIAWTSLENRRMVEPSSVGVGYSSVDNPKR